MQTDDIRPITDHRDHLREDYARVQETGRPLFITAKGRPAGVLLSPAAYDDLMRRAQLAEDVVALREALAESKAGKGRDAKTALREIAATLGVTLDR